MRKTAILLALACAFARADYGPGTTDSDLLRSGTPVVTNAWLAVSNETVRIARSVAGDAVAITDGTNRIDATRDVWRMYSGRVCTNASEVWTYSVGGATYTAEQMADAVGGGDSGYSQTLSWMNSSFLGKDGEEEQFEGWFVIDGSGARPVGYSYITGETPESSADHFLAFAEYVGLDYTGMTNVSITAFRGTFESGTNYVGRLALTNDIPSSVSVVAPSTDATAGTAADAKATGTALYTGFTEWVCDPPTYNGRAVEVKLFTNQLFMRFWRLQYVSDGEVIELILADGPGDESLDELVFEEAGVTATRHLVTPTKTSQLTNDGSNGVPFAVVSQIPAPVDISGKQDALTPAQTNAVNSGVTSEKVQTWDGYAALISAKVSTNALAGQTYDFSRNYDIIRATAAIAEALGATVTNNPTAQGGN